ncbi:DAK2 domain-containing protein [Helcococcus kunzii]|uniref:DAK2 domain-containing protein n=1 Tax=Helcococcus kunzii TaxID=40091 RepID=UPI001C967490|nr:DAK2 domain-containing protein [Helcococcus kunzii]QZO77247.1 DAK2 domain-containing protein [Helcococcus kunzii]
MRKIGYEDLRIGLKGSYKNLESNKEYVNGLNVFPVPDGDTGTNMSLTFKSVMKKLNETDDGSMKTIAKALSTGSLMGARGNSGVILSQLCRGFSKVVEKVDELDIVNIVEAFESAKETAYNAVLKPTEGTILTVSRMMAEFARKEFLNYDDALEFLKNVIDEGNRALNLTPELLPVLKEAGVVDAGGKGLMVLLEGFYKAINGENLDDVLEEEDVLSLDLKKTIEHHSYVRPEDIVYGYCTEFLINHDGSESYEEFKSVIQEYGDSIVCVGVDNLIKTHIHTDDPGKVLSLARQRGELSDIKIENMRFQNQEVNRIKDEQNKAKEKETKAESKEYGFVTISIGEGFDQIFKELNVDKIVTGGQTMNPSTQDIVDAVNEVNAKNVFIFPNNKNIILAAKQAVPIVDCNLIVIETKSIPQSFIALLNFDETATPNVNERNMTNSLSEITSLQLTYAIRDTKSGDLEIKKDDYIGLKNGAIVVKGDKLEDTFRELVKNALDIDNSILSIYYGEDVTEDQASELASQLEEEFPLIDIELNYGGQPLYYYIASVE